MTERKTNMRTLPIRGLRIDWDQISPSSYLRGIEAIASLHELEFRRNITFFVGENGSGKSTLLEAIAVSYGFNPEGGTKNYRFSTYDSHSPLCRAMCLSKGFDRPSWGYFLRAESLYNVASAEEEYSRSGGISMHLHERSHGESFLAIAQQYFQGRGIYILDEPEAALSPQRQLTLLIEIAECARQNAQFIIVTHSPILLGMPDAEILCFDDGPLHPIAYEETDSYRITKMFLDNREGMLRRLLPEESG